MNWPLIVLTTLLAMDVGAAAAKDGQPKSDIKYSVLQSFITMVIVLTLAVNIN